jgi:hypothetical protein
MGSSRGSAKGSGATDTGLAAPSQWIERDTGTVKAFAGVIQTAVAVNP